MPANESKSALDLVITRKLAAPVELLWRCWTEPEHFVKWWAPRPVKVELRTLDVRAGGGISTIMTLEDGTAIPTNGAFLDVVKHKRLVFTDALEAGYRPLKSPFMTAIITMEPSAKGVIYTAEVLHHSEADRIRHEKMGFFDGWGTCITQLEEVARGLRS